MRMLQEFQVLVTVGSVEIAPQFIEAIYTDLLFSVRASHYGNFKTTVLKSIIPSVTAHYFQISNPSRSALIS